MPRRARTMPSCATRCCSSATRRSSRRRTATSARRPSRPASTSRPAALLTLVEPHPWIVANFRETQLRRVRAGDVVQLRFDALPQRVFTGRIDSLSPATGAQFALLPPDNATGNFTKVTQRVPVKILLDGPAATEQRIRPGLSVVVTLQPGGESR